MKICEMFPSVNGEGDEVGRRTLFVRTFGCSAHCPDCDTPWSWGKETEDVREVEPIEILNEAKKYDLKHITITGGEPFEQENLMEFIGWLQQNGMQITIETNGTVFRDGMRRVHIVVSPKPWMLIDKNRDSYFRWAVVGATFKFAGSPDDVRRIRKWYKILRLKKAYLQPWIDPKKTNISHMRAAYTNILVEVQKQFNDGEDIRVVPQVHKFIWLDKRGV